MREAEGFRELVCGLDFGEAWEALVDEDVVLVAGEHELLAAHLHHGDGAAGREQADFLHAQQVAHPSAVELACPDPPRGCAPADIQARALSVTLSVFRYRRKNCSFT